MTSTVKITCGFIPISEGDQFFRVSTWDKGRALYTAKHVRLVTETAHPAHADPDTGTGSVITSRCLPQTKVNATEYTISIQLSSDRRIQTANCTCKAGITGKCKHTAATVIAVNCELPTSKTSRRQEWGIPSTKKVYQPATIQSLFPKHKPPESPVTPYSLTILDHFQDLDCPLLSALRAAKDTNEECSVREVLNEIITSVHFNVEQDLMETTLLQTQKLQSISYSPATIRNLSPDLSQFYVTNIRTSQEKAREVAIRTSQQSGNSEWYKVRKVRISSSKAHRIYTRKSSMTKLAHDLFNTKSFSNQSTQYGLQNESTARNLFSRNLKRRVITAGVIISFREPWLCASPDGLVLELDGKVSLLEIKCPFSLKGKSVIENSGKVNLPYLEMANGKIQLKKNHGYYCQIQIAMYVSNIKLTHFYVYTSKEQVHIEIPVDEEYLKICIPKLYTFYFETYLPYIFENKV